MLLKNHVLYAVCTTLLCELWSWSNAEVFTAVTDCEPLLNTYKLVIDDLDNYVQKEERRLLTLKNTLDLFKREHAMAMEDVPNYLGNPINAFTLLKRLTADLVEIEKNAYLSTGLIRNTTKNKTDVMFPNTEDLIGVATALTRLQKTYKLQVNQLAEGNINGVTYSLPMSAGDCYELGRILYNNTDYKSCVKWMLKAFSKYEDKKETDVYSFALVDVMDYISWSYYRLDDVRNASIWMKKRLALDPSHIRAQDNLRFFKRTIAVNGVKEQPQAQRKTNIEYNVDLYEATCRGDLEPAPEITKTLTCFYLTRNDPFLQLAPFKAEQLHKDPDVFIFYDVISDKEIEHIKALAKPKLQRAKVHDTITGQNHPAQFRISKSAFLIDDDVISRISLRITDFTGLCMDFPELLQVVNYGIGGQYEPHFDQVQKPYNGHRFHSSQGGNRIATVLFYMSEVAQGGATAFMQLGLSVFPVKNAALFWMNLHPSGEGDLSTLHAGCPVLRGSKWVSNKWIRHTGQEFLRPCSLEYQEEGINRQLPPPILKYST